MVTLLAWYTFTAYYHDKDPSEVLYTVATY